MTKKKGFFSKIKDKVSKDSSKSSDDEALEFDSDEFEEVEYDEDEGEDQNLEDDEDYENYEDEELDSDDTNITINDEGDFVEEPKKGFFSKLKSKFKKDDDHFEDEEFEDDEYEYEDEDEDEYNEELEAESEKGQDLQESLETGSIKVNSDDQSEQDEDIVLAPEINEESLAAIKVPTGDDDDSDDSDDIGEKSSTDIKINLEGLKAGPDSETQSYSQEVEEVEDQIEDFESQDQDSELNYEDEDDEYTDLSEFPLPRKDIPEQKKSAIPLFDNLLRKFKRKVSQADGHPFTGSAQKETQKSSKGLVQISKEQIIPSLIGRTARRRIHISFLYALVAIFFYNTGKFAGLYLSKEKPSAKVERSSKRFAKTYSPRKDIANIKSSNPFNALESEEEKVKVKEEVKKAPEIKVCLQADTKSRLPIKLVNTVVLQDSVKSVASVSQRGKIISIREGDKIDNIAEVGKINRKKVIFKNLESKTCEFIENAEKPSKFKAPKVYSRSEGKKLINQNKNNEIQVTGNDYKIKKSLRDRALADMGKILTQARAIQIKNPDGTLSFKMTEIVPGSIYSQLDIQDDDIITAIGGKKIRNINELMSMFGKIKQNDNYEITVKRNGTEKTMNYNFTE